MNAGFRRCWHSYWVSDQPAQSRFLKICEKHLVRLSKRATRNCWLTEPRFFNCPSSPADHVVSKLLADDAFMEWYKSEYRTRLASSYEFATKFMDEHGIKYMPVNAGLFLMINLGDTVFKGLKDEDIYQRLRAKKVYILPGTSFKYESSGWFRAVIAHPISTLQEGFKRLLLAIPQPDQGLPVEELEKLSFDNK